MHTRTGPRRRPSPARESDLSRLPRIIEDLTARLDALQPGDEALAKLAEANRRLEDALESVTTNLDARLASLDAKLAEPAADSDAAQALRDRLDAIDATLGNDVAGRVESLDARLAEALDGKLGEFAGTVRRELDDVRASVKSVANALSSLNGKTVTPEALEALRREVRDNQSTLLTRMVEQHESEKRELNSLLGPDRMNTVEVDIDDLADRLVLGVRNHATFLDPDAGKAVDAMVRLAENMVKEQTTNTARIDNLAVEIHNAAAALAKLDEWQDALPERVADEIAQTVEARVVGPISGALARQAPAILSELQDTKLVDIVSRSVREAQRPLLREILAGGRAGVPVWLFASVLLPLLLILGYLFLPGEIIGGPGDSAAVNEEIAESLARIEGGLGLASDNEDRLRTIEDAVLDIHSEALTHVKNAAMLEEEVRNLRATVAERDRLIQDYNTTLQNQVQRLREYEMRLVQLGVSPRTGE